MKKLLLTLTLIGLSASCFATITAAPSKICFKNDVTPDLEANHIQLQLSYPYNSFAYWGVVAPEGRYTCIDPYKQFQEQIFTTYGAYHSGPFNLQTYARCKNNGYIYLYSTQGPKSKASAPVYLDLKLKLGYVDCDLNFSPQQ